MVDGEAEIVVVLDIQAGRASVMLPDESVEDWSVSSLPPGVVAGDRVSITVTNGDMEMEVLPAHGVRA